MKKQLLVLAIVALFAVPQNGQARHGAFDDIAHNNRGHNNRGHNNIFKGNGKLIASVFNHMGKALEHIAQAANHAAQAAKNSEQATKQN